MIMMMNDDDEDDIVAWSNEGGTPILNEILNRVTNMDGLVPFLFPSGNCWMIDRFLLWPTCSLPSASSISSVQSIPMQRYCYNIESKRSLDFSKCLIPIVTMKTLQFRCLMTDNRRDVLSTRQATSISVLGKDATT